MVRTYKRTTLPVDADKLRQAISSVKLDGNQVKTAARRFGVPATTLRRHVLKVDKPKWRSQVSICVVFVFVFFLVHVSFELCLCFILISIGFQCTAGKKIDEILAAIVLWSYSLWS